MSKSVKSNVIESGGNGQLQQGDVLLTKYAIPKGAKPAKPNWNGQYVLAFGEATGVCHHVEERDTKTEIEYLELGQELFMRIQGGNAAVVHARLDGQPSSESHDELLLEPGEYKVGHVHEYDYDTEEARRVID